MLQAELEKRVAEEFCDKNNHVQSTNYFFLFDDARAELLARIDLSEQFFREHGEPLYARDQQCSYRRQLLRGENIRLIARIRDMPRLGLLTIEYEILKPGRILAARGRGVYAFVDRKTGKHRQIPGYFLEAIKQYIDVEK